MADELCPEWQILKFSLFYVLEIQFRFRLREKYFLLRRLNKETKRSFLNRFREFF